MPRAPSTGGLLGPGAQPYYLLLLTTTYYYYLRLLTGGLSGSGAQRPDPIRGAPALHAEDRDRLHPQARVT